MEFYPVNNGDIYHIKWFLRMISEPSTVPVSANPLDELDQVLEDLAVFTVETGVFF